MERPRPTFLGTDRFLLQGCLGKGGGGEVHSAYDKKTNQYVALKFLQRVDAQNIERFKKEFLFASALEHPNLLKFHEFFEEQGQYFFTTELIEGNDLISYVRPAHTSSDEHRLRHCLAQVASGIVALHSQGKVHRDLKPSNILVESDGRVVILDFGLATEVIGGWQIDDIGTMGTIAYMAPEQSIGMPVSAAVDWYALGVVLYQALTGRLPFEGSNSQILMNLQMTEPLTPRKHVADAPTDLISLCEDLLLHDPRVRPNGRAVFERLGIQHSLVPKSFFVEGVAETYEESIPFIGRTEELEALHATLAESRLGTPKSVLILAEAGEGKTALAREFLTQAMLQHDDIVVLSGKFLKNSSLHFQACEDLVADLSKRLVHSNLCSSSEDETGTQESGELALTSMEATVAQQVFPVLGRIPAVSRTAGFFLEKSNLGVVRAQAFQTVRKLLCSLASRHLPILFLDDLQWAKTDSLDFLKEIIYPDTAQPLSLLLVATMRTGSQTSSEMTQVLPHSRQIALKRLSDENVIELSHAMYRTYNVEVPSHEKLTALAKEASGHPLFVTELVRHMMMGEDVAPLRLEEVIWSRVQSLEKETRLLLELISLAGVDLDHETLADAAAMDVADCRRRVSCLLTRNLVRSSGGFGTETLLPYHDRIHEVIADKIDKETAQKHHHRLAYTMESEDSLYGQALMVNHLEKAGVLRQAGEMAARAAEKAENGLAFGQAVDLLKTALRLGDLQDGERQKLLMRLGDALCNIGQGAEASKAYLEARQSTDMTTRFGLWRRAAGQLILAGHFHEGLEQLKLLLAEIGKGFSKNRTRTLVSLLWYRLVLRIRGLRWKERSESSIDPRDLAKLDVYEVIAENLVLVDNVLGAEYQVCRLLTALRLGESKRLGHALALESGFVSSQGSAWAFRRGRDLLNRARNIANQNSILNLKVQVRGSEAWLEYFKGNLRASVALFLEAQKEGKGEAAATIFQLNTAYIMEIRILRSLGDFVKLGEKSERYLRDAARRGDKYLDTNIRYHRSQIWLARNQLEKAAKDLAEAAWSPPEGGGYHLQHWFETIARAEIDLYQGNMDKKLDEFEKNFQGLKKSLLLRVGNIRAESSWLRGRIFLAVAAVSSGPSARHLVRRATRLARRLAKKNIGFRQAAVWALLLRAAIADQEGMREDSIAYLKQAITESEDKETPQLAAAARLRLGQILGGQEGGKILAEGDSWMKKNGIVNPESMTEVFLPGFVSIRAQTKSAADK